MKHDIYKINNRILAVGAKNEYNIEIYYNLLFIHSINKKKKKIF